MIRRVLLLYIVIVLCLTLNALNEKIQMRAAWIATVANIDWPSSPDISATEQMKEMTDMLDSLQALNMNAVIFQIRPTADAFYYSDFEPWSHYLTGRQGEEPEPYYDPLAFVVHEAHRRCMQVHVWLNPYRTLNEDDLSILTENHLYHRRPDMFVKYGGKYYFNPGLDVTREYLNDVVADIVTRYDIDAIHFDDYFYPYRIAGQEFPDSETFRRYPRGFTDKDAWRRNNVDMVIKELQRTIKSRKPWVEFGISPFGVWRNKSADPMGSDTRAGQTNYDDLYADVLKWMREGDIDYVVPQLYWEIGKAVADYRILADWWADNAYNCNLYIGVSASNLGMIKGEAWHRPNELCRQMRMNDTIERIDGIVFYSCRPFLRNPQGICDSLTTTFFKYPALIPSNPMLGGKPSPQPDSLRIERFGARDYLMWNEVDGDGGEAVAYYVVYAFDRDQTIDLSLSENILCKTIDSSVDITSAGLDKWRDYTFVVTSVNRYNIESEGVNYVNYSFQGRN